LCKFHLIVKYAFQQEAKQWHDNSYRHNAKQKAKKEFYWLRDVGIV